jgi:hypothetical protein
VVEKIQHFLNSKSSKDNKVATANSVQHATVRVIVEVSEKRAVLLLQKISQSFSASFYHSTPKECDIKK